MTWRAALAAIIAAPAFALIPAHAQTTMPVQLQTFSFVSGDAAAGTVVRDAPYSGEGETTVSMTLSDGTRITRQVTAKYYRDSEGRIRREQTVLGLAALNPSNESEQIVTIVDPVAGAMYALNPSTRTAYRIPLSKQTFDASAPPGTPGTLGAPTSDHVLIAGTVPAMPAMPMGIGEMAVGVGPTSHVVIADRAAGTAAAGVSTSAFTAASGSGSVPPEAGASGSAAAPIVARTRTFAADVAGPAMATVSDDAKEEPLGTREISGVSATGRKTSLTIPTGQIGNDRPIEITDERWESPELQLLLQSKHHDPRTGDIEFQLKNLTRAEPPPDLFEVPADYTLADAPPPPPPPPAPGAGVQMRTRPQ